ncbi:MAG: RNA polymerase sigma factor [Actinomycetota bacterium]
MDAGEAYRSLGPAVLGYLRGQGASDPEDLLSEVFLQVARSLPRFRGDDDAMRRWIFTIARNRLIDESRRRRRRPSTRAGPVPDVPARSAEDSFDPALLRALGQLTADQREVVVLRFVADLSLDEVATITKRAPGAVKSMQHRALAQLARILERESDAVPGDG